MVRYKERTENEWKSSPKKNFDRKPEELQLKTTLKNLQTAWIVGGKLKKWGMTQDFSHRTDKSAVSVAADITVSNNVYFLVIQIITKLY